MPISNGQTSRRKITTVSSITSASGTDGLRAQGMRTRNAIIRVARDLLLDHGPLEFSLRAVALHAGISVSNLQYYFPTRPAVLRAVMAPIFEAYLGDLRQMVESGASASDVFDAVVARGVQDAKESKNAEMWWHFFSFSATDTECSQLRDEWYDTLASELARLVRTLNPDHEERESWHIAILLISMVDGLTLHLGRAGERQAYVAGVEKKFAETAEYLVWGERPRHSASQ